MTNSTSGIFLLSFLYLPICNAPAHKGGMLSHDLNIILLQPTIHLYHISQHLRDTAAVFLSTLEEQDNPSMYFVQMFLEDLGLTESGLEKLVRASYHLLGLMSFLTAGEDETRAWTIKIGTKAPQAAGKIHTDFERGFIKAEVVNYQDLLDCGSYAGAREKGLVRMEGKDYVVQDGDVILFRFNV